MEPVHLVLQSATPLVRLDGQSRHQPLSQLVRLQQLFQRQGPTASSFPLPIQKTRAFHWSYFCMGTALPERNKRVI